MTLQLAAGMALAMVTIALAVMTVSYLTHSPATCRTCVDRAAAEARRRHPGARSPAPEDRPEWGRM